MSLCENHKHIIISGAGALTMISSGNGTVVSLSDRMHSFILMVNKCSSPAIGILTMNYWFELFDSISTAAEAWGNQVCIKPYLIDMKQPIIYVSSVTTYI